jgi:putative RNA 2'-phosphotransferase
MMSKFDAVRISKFLSLVLRHEPGKIGIKLDDAGWVSVDELLRGCAASGLAISRDELDAVVANSDKQRFAFSDDRTRIRANQGHSVEVELGYEPAAPPAVLYYGTPEKFVEAIRREGLNKMQRHHVHLSESPAITLAAAARRGKPVLLTIDAAAMARDGLTFFVTPNRVWLTEGVPAKYLVFDQG